ncbi:MAG: ribokinase [Verrucomicrobiota bacterium]
MNASSHRIVVVGSLNADFVIRVDRYPVPGETLVGQQFNIFPGGKGANQAYAAGKLGASVAMIGQVGNDSQADWLKENLRAAGVDVSPILTDPGTSSGIATITIDRLGQNQIIIVPGANGTFNPARLEPSQAALQSAGLVLLQLEIPLATVEASARLAREGRATVILDPAPAQDLSDSLLHLTDYLTPNEGELALLTGHAPGALTRAEATVLSRQLVSRGARKVLVKMGHKGALLVAQSYEHFWPAIPVEAVDTTAAGDAFNGAFAAALARGESEVEAGWYATAAAACSVTRLGAQPSMPNDEEVRSFLQRIGVRS